MPTTIDQLQIEIEAKSEGANKSLNKLKQTLESINKAAKSSGLDTTCKRLEKIASLDFSNLSSLTNLSKATEPMRKANERMQELASSMDAVNKMPKELSMDLEVPGADVISSAADNLIQTSSAADILQMKLDGVKDKLANALEKPDTNTSTIGNLVERAQKLQTQLDRVADSAAKVPTELKPTVEAGGVTTAAQEIKSATDAVKASVNSMPQSVNVPVNTPGVEAANGKLSLTQVLLGRITAASSSAGRGIRRLGTYFRTLGTSAASSTKKAFKGISQLLNIVLVYGGAFQAYMLFQQGVSEGLQNISKYSSETANSMNRLSTMSLYLKNSIGAALYPVIVAITPALQSMTNAIVRALNAFNQFVAAWSGADTYIRAKEYLKEYGEEATETANKVKRSFAGMDEITVIGNQDSSAASSMPDYSRMFETAPISDTTSSVVENLKKNIDNLKINLGGAALVVGAILTFSGANIPLGLGLMVAGGYLIGSAVAENWNSVSGTLEDKISGILVIISAAMIVIGAILAFSGVATPLGIALIAGGVAGLGITAAENWEGLSQNVKNTITVIGLAVGAALLVVGAILAFSGVGIPLGIGLMLAGAVTLGAAATLGWEALPENVKNTLSIILAAISAALIVIGVVLVLITTGIAAPIGIAMILVGAAGMVTAVAINWDWVKEKVNTVIASILAILSAAGLVLGILLCLTGGGIPLGIALIMASIKGVQKASDMDDNPVTRFVKNMINGCIEIVEKGVNYIIGILNKINVTVPDWIPGIGGRNFGFNIRPVSIPRLKDGGFPDGEDGLFFANHTELVGKFSNGKTAVANNDQIVTGIQRGVATANETQNQILREQNDLLRQLLRKKSSTVISTGAMENGMSSRNTRAGAITVPVNA